MKKSFFQKINISSILLGVVLVFIFTFSLIQSNQQQEALPTNTSNISNKKIGWGIKREDNHKQPDLGSQNKKVIDEYQGIAMGNAEKPYVYLTFDEGYEAGYTEKMLAVLKENQVSATFFLTAHYLNTQPDLVKKMIDEGHIVGNHTVNHKSMPDLSDDQLKKEVMDYVEVFYE